MKKLSIFLTAFMSLALLSCDDEDAQVFNPEDGSIAYFTKTRDAKFPIREENVTGTYYIEVGSTTVSSVDRPINMSVIAESTTATPAMYTIDPSTLVIPAGQYVGKVKVTTAYNLLPEVGTQAVVAFKLNTVDGNVVLSEQGTDVFTLRMFKSCAIQNFPTTYNAIVTAFGSNAPSHVVNFVPQEDENTYKISSSWGPDFVAWATDDESLADSYYYPGTIVINCDYSVTFDGQYGTGTGTYSPGMGLITLTINQNLFTSPFTVDIAFLPQN